MVAGGRFAPGHLGELTQQVPFEMVDAVLEQTCRVQRRVRDLPARVVVYLLLAGCLFAELGYSQVWHRLTAGLDGLPVAAPTASAMTQARRRLGPGPLRELFFLLRGPDPAGARWRGLLVVRDRRHDHVRRRQRGEPGRLLQAARRPQRRTPATRSCGCWPWSAAAPAPSSTPCSGPTSAGETACAPGLLPGSLHAGMLLLADRNFAAGFLASADRGGRRRTS